jgi:hypothetical protein
LTEPEGQAYPAEQGPSQVLFAWPGTAPKRPAGHCPLQATEDKPLVAPYKPAGQSLQDPAPDALYRPAGHSDAVVLVEPAGHAYPGVHSPLHAAVVRPAVDPYKPAAHWAHDPDPATLNDPAGHSCDVGLVLPAGQAYPALQLPVHVGAVRPPTAPKLPAVHRPVHAALVSPVDDPYVPAGHWVHTPAPVKLYVPAEHTVAVGDVDPKGHAYPAVHEPEHPADANADPDPYCPAGQYVQLPAPTKLYVPAPHADAVAAEDPAAHA